MSKYNVMQEDGLILEMNLEERIKYECDLISNMTDEEVCSTFNVDTRDEAIQSTVEYFTFIY